jgi:hypothetical protein
VAAYAGPMPTPWRSGSIEWGSKGSPTPAIGVCATL